MVNKILEVFGLVKISNVRDLSVNPYSVEELDLMYVDHAVERSIGWDRDKYNTLLDLLKKNDYLAQFLDWTIAEDVKRAFNVTDEERPIVRGAVSRTRYLRSLCVNKEELNKSLKNKITRYAR